MGFKINVFPYVCLPIYFILLIDFILLLTFSSCDSISMFFVAIDCNQLELKLKLELKLELELIVIQLFRNCSVISSEYVPCRMATKVCSTDW